MPLKIACQMDPIDRIDIRGDSTFAMLLEALLTAVGIEAGIGVGVEACGESQVDEAPHLARFLLVHEVERVEVFDLAGKCHGKASGVKGPDGRGAAGIIDAIKHLVPPCMERKIDLQFSPCGRGKSSWSEPQQQLQ